MDGLFPIGYDDHDGVINIGAGGSIVGKILVMDEENTKLTPKSSEEDILSDRGVYLISESFDEFVDNLEIVEKS